MSDPQPFVDGVRPNQLFFKHVLRKVFLEDWLLKVTALLITLALWYGVSVSNKKGTATMAAQLTFRVAEDVVLTGAGVQDVTIRVAGDDQKIDQLFGSDIRVTADLTQVGAGDRILDLTPENVTIALPPGVRLDDIQPSRIAVRLESLVEQDVPVTAETVGEPAPGFEVYSTTATPAKVRIRGPASYMSTLESVPTGPVDVGGAKSDLTARQVPLSIANPKAAVYNTVVDVSVVVGEKRIERSYVLNANGDRVTAVLFGPRSVLSKIKTADLKVEIESLQSGERSPTLTLPESLRGTIEIRELRVD